MTSSAFIRGIASYLPAAVLTNAELEQRFPDWTAAKILDKTGIAQRHIAADGELASDMATAAARRLLERDAIDPATIDVLIFCSQSLDYILPSSACLIQDRLGLPLTCMSFDLSLGCSSYVHALSIAGALLESGRGRRALVLTADTYSKYLDPEDRAVVTLFGDAGTATLLDTAEGEPGGAHLGPFVTGTDGGGARDLIIETGGNRNGPPAASASPAAQRRHRPDRLFMDGPKIFEFSLRRVPEALKRVLESARLAPTDVDLFVFHQANRFMLEALQKKLKLPAERFAIEMEDVGNTVSSTIPLALERLMAAGRIKSGSVLALVGFGVGYSWAAGIVRWK
jgi:3-oxoacyl-[acyl-carrier-protein] synthase-3